MEKEIFAEQLRKAANTTIEFAKTLCWNTFSENCVYIIEPSDREYSDHLNNNELDVLKLWNKNKNTQLSFESTVNLLWHDNQVPLWINIGIYRSLSNKTIIELLCSRRLREEQELMHQNEIPPFHILISTPFGPWDEKAQKFDVNWKYDKQKKRKIVEWFSKVIRYLKTI